MQCNMVLVLVDKKELNVLGLRSIKKGLKHFVKSDLVLIN